MWRIVPLVLLPPLLLLLPVSWSPLKQPTAWRQYAEHDDDSSGEDDDDEWEMIYVRRRRRRL